MSNEEYEVRKKMLEAESAPRLERLPEPEVQIPRAERSVTRGTLTERDNRSNAFDDVASGAFRASSIRLTPPPDSMHIPSGPRDLKEYDTPAYLRRGISLPQIDEEAEQEDLVPAGHNAAPERPAPTPRDDRPTFLRRIMD
jgi:hypothetical protein